MQQPVIKNVAPEMLYVWPMASNNDNSSSTDNNETPVDNRDDVLTVYFSSSCASKHPGRSCRQAGCRHYKASHTNGGADGLDSSTQNSTCASPQTPHWATSSRADNWTPSPHARDEYYNRRIGLLLNFDSIAARNLVGLMGNKSHKDAGVQVSSALVDGEMQAAPRHVPPAAAASHAQELSSSKLSFFDVADISGTHPPVPDGTIGPLVRRSNSVVRLGLAKEFLREMKECFDTFDKNKDGSISVDELTDVMRMLGLEQNSDQIQAMIKAIDRNKNGQIEFGEFVELMKEQWALGEGRGLGSTDDEVERVFRIFDKNNDGKISPEELRMVMSHLGEQLSDADLAYMMQVADLDRDGQIDIDEFRNLILLASASAAITPACLAVRHSCIPASLVHQSYPTSNHNHNSSSNSSNNSNALQSTSTGTASPARPYNHTSRNSDSTRA